MCWLTEKKEKLYTKIIFRTVQNKNIYLIKSINSAALSISAWITVLAWPSIVAAFNFCRYLVAIISAAFLHIATLSFKGTLSQCRCASTAVSIAFFTNSYGAHTLGHNTYSLYSLLCDESIIQKCKKELCLTFFHIIYGFCNEACDDILLWKEKS